MRLVFAADDIGGILSSIGNAVKPFMKYIPMAVTALAENGFSVPKKIFDFFGQLSGHS